MALPSPRDLDEARHILTEWLGRQLPDADGVALSALSGPAASGFSNETIVFDATWSQGGQEHSQGFVIRVRPSSHSVFPSDRFDDQVRVLRALQPLGVRVPVVRWYETDPSVLGEPFIVMERVTGQAPSDFPPYTDEGFLFDSTPQQQEQLWWSGLEHLASVDTVDLGSVDLSFLGDGSAHGGGSLADRVAYWERYLEWGGGDDHHPVPEAAIAWLRANMPPDSTEPPALCWGDARIGNQLFHEHEVTAILDWEMVHIGDPVWDLAWYVWLDRHFSEGCERPRLPGFPTVDATVARWQELTGRTVTDFQWHQVLAGLAFGVIMVRLAHLLVHFELFPPDSDFAHTNTAVTFLAAELDRIGAR